MSRSSRLQPVALGVASLPGMSASSPREMFFIVDDGFQISLYAWLDRGLQFMCDVLRQLAFQADLLFFLGDVVDGYLEA